MKRLISIGGGEPEYDTPKHIVDAMKKAMDEGQTHYGDFRHILELREAVASKYHKYGVDVDPEHVIITPGSTMGIYMTFRTLMQPGEEYITMDPCFFGYYGPAEELGVNAVPVPRYKDENWEYHMEDIQKATTDKTKGILICSPDNPTGSVLSDEKLKEIAEYSIENNVLRRAHL
jgi:aspartate/methionine/tyrosine aminotransferase